LRNGGNFSKNNYIKLKNLKNKKNNRKEIDYFEKVDVNE